MSDVPDTAQIGSNSPLNGTGEATISSSSSPALVAKNQQRSGGGSDEDKTSKGGVDETNTKKNWIKFDNDDDQPADITATAQDASGSRGRSAQVSRKKVKLGFVHFVR